MLTDELYNAYLQHDFGEYISDEQLLAEAIASIEGQFKYMSDAEILHHQRVLAIAYLALKRYSDKR